MEKLALQKVATFAAALALGSTCIANDAPARSASGFGGQRGSVGNKIAKNHMGGFPVGPMGRDFHASQSGSNDSNAFEINCWKVRDIPPNPAHEEDDSCY
jgi:hypothetical protein